MLKLKANFQNILLALWAPLAWLMFLIIDIIFLGDRKAQSFLGRVFEDLVFITSFLFYSPTWGIYPEERNYASVFSRAALQFFFWWLIAFSIITLIKKRRS